MNQDIVEKTKKTAELYFKGVGDERPFDLWKAFDKDFAKDLSLFITGQMYAREKIRTRPANWSRWPVSRCSRAWRS